MAIVLGMVRPRPFAAAALSGALLVPAAARAGETRCWYENGAVVVPAAFGDIAGDFLLDVSAPRTLLHADRARSDTIAEAAATRDLVLAGERVRGVEALVASFDEREVGFPTTINGLIGADVLSRYVVTIDFAPCRVTLSRRAPAASPGAIRLPIETVNGVPAIRAAVSDGARAFEGRFAIDTASADVRLRSADAGFRPPLAQGVDPTWRFRPPARLARLTLGGETLEHVPAGLLEYDLPGLDGAIGDAVWAHYRMTLDLKRGWLTLEPSP
ncbi:MAG TPA: hypothetical protein VG939_15650 [Caulobacteraceae bacterium]|nr:hypothetical protein [Caulobacteraceae bacterium]